MNVIGKCSLCGGSVVQQELGHGHGLPLAPQCLQCGATKKNELPIVEMEKSDWGQPRLLNEHLKWQHDNSED